MGVFGEIGLGGLGELAGQYFGGSSGRDAGRKIGSTLGSFLPFKQGGRVMKLRKGGMMGDGDAGAFAEGGYVPPGLRQVGGGNIQFHVLPHPSIGVQRLI